MSTTQNTPNVLAQVAQRRREKIRDLHYDYEIPTWGGDIVARFVVAEREDVEAFSNGARNAKSDMDFIIKSLQTICFKHPDTGKIQPLLTDADTYVGFDEILAEKLGVADEIAAMVTGEDGPARAMVAFMFNGNEIAIGACCGQLIVWMQNTDKKVAQGLLGE